MSPEQVVALSLVRRIAGQDEDALVEFHKQFINLVYSVAVRCLGNAPDAEEVCQDVFLTLWRRAETYDPGKGAVSTWLVTMTRRKAIDFFRARRGLLANNSPLEEFENVLPDTNDDIKDIDLQRAMSDLPGDQRQCLELIYYNGLTQEEAASKLHLPLGTVKSRVRLAVGRLRNVMMA
jgi:RNA polymerase sigma-70 factor (ECF subfamily)